MVDDEDKTLEEYKKRYGDAVIVFSKNEAANLFDSADNFGIKKTITHARNAVFIAAKEKGLKYFLQLDDDYTEFAFKFYGDKGKDKSIKNLNKVFDLTIDFLEKCGAFSVAFAQGGDFIGGKKSKVNKEGKLLRKCMNTFFCKTDTSINFVGSMNEDVNTYCSLGMRGGLFFTVPQIGITQGATQSNAGGITDTYLKYGTYVKSFYTVIFCPAFVRIGEMGNKNMRIHHKIRWRNAVPMILDEKHKKK